MIQTSNSWQSWAEKAMLDYVKQQMASLKFPNTNELAKACIYEYFWQMQQDGQIYYTGVRRSIKKFYSTKHQEP